MNTHIISAEFLKQTAFMVRYGTLEAERSHLLELFRMVIDSNDENHIAILLPALRNIDWLTHDLVNKILLLKMEEVSNFLLYCPSLSIKELLFVVEELRDEQKIIAITKRRKLSKRVIDKIIQSRNVNTLIPLIKNPHILLTLNHYQEIIRLFYNDIRIINTLINRNEYVEYEILEVLSYLRNELSASEIDAVYNILRNDQKDQVVCSFQKHNRECINQFPSTNIRQKIDELLNANQLYFAFLIKLLCDGDIDGFLYGVSKLADVSYYYLLSIVKDRLYTEEFTNIYQASGLNSELLKAVQVILNLATQLAKHQALEKSELLAQILSQIKVQNLSEEIPQLKFLTKLMGAEV